MISAIFTSRFFTVLAVVAITLFLMMGAAGAALIAVGGVIISSAAPIMGLALAVAVGLLIAALRYSFK